MQDAIQKFMYHDDVRPKLSGDGVGFVGGADGSCLKKTQISWNFGNFQ